MQEPSTEDFNTDVLPEAAKEGKLRVDDEKEVIEPVQESPVKQAPRTASEMMAAIKEMKAGGMITASQASELRGELGVKASSFTKHQATKTDKKKNRKAQKAARRTGGRGRG